MKNWHLLLFVAALLLTQTTLHAQTQRRTVMLGGTVGATAQNGDSNFGGRADLTVGFFVVERLAIGGALTYALAFRGESSIITFGGGPLVRYYLRGSGNFRAFGQGNFSVVSQDIGSGPKRAAIGYGAGAGADIFLNDRVAIEIILGYDHFPKKIEYAAPSGINRVSFSFGIQAFIAGAD